MLNFDQFKSKNIGIYGLGMTGSSIAETLNSSGANVYVWDDNPSIRKKNKKPTRNKERGFKERYIN